MANILDTLDVLKNIEGMYENNSSFNVLKDFERVLDELDLYVYDNWIDGELAAGPEIERHWVTCKFFWPYKKMPDPMGGKRLVDYNCKVSYQKSYFITPRKIREPDDFRPGTKKGKLDKEVIWIVEIRMPRKLLEDFHSGNMEDLEIKSEETPGLDLEEPSVQPESQDPGAGGEPAGGPPPGDTTPIGGGLF